MTNRPDFGTTTTIRGRRSRILNHETPTTKEPYTLLLYCPACWWQGGCIDEHHAQELCRAVTYTPQSGNGRVYEIPAHACADCVIFRRRLVRLKLTFFPKDRGKIGPDSKVVDLW